MSVRSPPGMRPDCAPPASTSSDEVVWDGYVLGAASG